VAETNKNLGKLLSVYAMAPAHLQRAVFIVILSFVFFLIMMIAYYVRQSMLYFLLSSAFLVIYVITLISWAMHRRNVVAVHENGLSYRGRSVEWSEIKSVDDHGTVSLNTGKPIILPKMLDRSDQLIASLRERSKN
jgi:hypothetical protein